jgi:uncharacterized membrane protein YadS
MGDKNKEILKLKNRQVQLKKDIKRSKTKIPKFIIGFVVFTILTLYALKDKAHVYFGSIINFVIVGMISLCITCIFFIYSSYSKIRKKEREIISINNNLYKLMKL